MPPKKRKRKAKTPKSTQRQSQRQSVVVNIGSTSKSKPRKSSGRGNLPPPSHMHNLAPTFVTAPQVDYTPLLAMMQHHASPIVAQAPMPVQNLTTPLSSANVATNTASQMARLAAEARRPGPTAGNFQAHPSSERSVSVPLLAALFDKPDSLSRASSPSVASTRVSLPSGRASVSAIKAMGAAEEQGRLAREKEFKSEQKEASQFLRSRVRGVKLEKWNQQLEPMMPSSVGIEQRELLRGEVSRSGINLGELSSKSQARLRISRT